METKEFRNSDINELDGEKFDLVKFVKNRFSSAKQWKFYYSGGNQEQWIRYIKFYKGRQWNRPGIFQEMSDDSKAKITLNMIFPIIQQEIPFMLDRKPKIYIEYKEPGDKKAAEILQSLIEDQMVNRELDIKLQETILFAKQTGTGFLMPFWNPDLANGLGDVDVIPLDPLNIFPFAYTKRLTDADGIIQAEYVPLSFIKENYPDKLSEFKGTKDDPGVPDRTRATNDDVDATRFTQLSDSATSISRTDYVPSESGGPLDESNFKRTLLLRCFVRDETTEEMSETTPEGNENIFEQKKYPLGRLVTVGNGLILEDKPWSYNFTPYIELHNYINAGEFWAQGDVEWLISAQMWFNKLNSLMADSLRRSVYTTKIMNAQSGIDIEAFVVTSDAIYESQIGNPLQELQHPGPSPQVFSYVETLRDYMRTISGVSEYSAPSSGRLPSGKSLQEFQEVTQIRLRQKLRNMEFAIRQLGRAWLEMILKNYQEARIMRIVNPTNRQSEYIYIFREDDPALAGQIRSQIGAQIEPGTEQIDPATQTPIPGSGKPLYKSILNLADIKGELDITVTTGSTVSTSKLAFFDQANILFQEGVIDAEALLEAADYPNREEITKRMQERSRVQAEQQAQMMQAPAPQKQPPLPPKVNLSLKGQDLIDPVAQQAVLAGLNGGGLNATLR